MLYYLAERERDLHDALPTAGFFLQPKRGRISVWTIGAALLLPQFSMSRGDYIYYKFIFNLPNNI